MDSDSVLPRPAPDVPGLTVFSPADPAHDDDLAAWIATWNAAQTGVWGPMASWWSAGEQRALALRPHRDRWFLLLRDPAGAPVAAGLFSRHLIDDPQDADADVAVLPERARRGHGRTVHDAIAALARARGVRRLVSSSDVPVAADGGAAYPATAAFAASLGYRDTQAELRNELPLPLDPARVAAVHALAAEGMGGQYAVETVSGRVPDAWLEDLALLHRRMSTDAPSGIGPSEEAWDVARVRAEEDTHEASGRLYVTAVARHVPDGRLVAYSQVSDSAADPATAYQQDTLVLREHRGRRLGLAMKLETAIALTAARPGIARVRTWNAEGNAPMLAVNRLLGFEVTGLGMERVLDLG